MSSISAALPLTRECICPSCELQYEGTVLRVRGEEVQSSCPRCPRDEVSAAELTAAPPPKQPGLGSILDDLHAGGVNVRKYRDSTLATFDPTHDPHALEAADAYLAQWEEAAREPFASIAWGFFYGAGSALEWPALKLGLLGNGKSHLAVAIGRRLLEKGLISRKGFRFVSCERLLLEAEATFRCTDRSEIELLDRFAEYEFLIVDDLGVRGRPSDHAVRLLDQLAKDREGRGTIWTSNLSIAVLSRQHDSMARIASRFAGECGPGRAFVIEFRGPDRRVRMTRRT